MATTFTATAAAASAPVRVDPDGGENVVVSTYTLTEGTINDVIQMVKVPKGAVITAITLACPDIDTNVSPTVTLSVGDGGSTARFISASTIGQAGGVASLSVPGGLGYTYTADDTIDVLIAAATATFAAGDITLVVKYKMQKNP